MYVFLGHYWCFGTEGEGEKPAVCGYEMVSFGISCRFACARYAID